MRDWAERLAKWTPPKDWRRVVSVDAHTEGEPLRVIVGGYPELEGDSILARRRDASVNHDGMRRALMWEPRGHADMYGCIVVTPVTAEADIGVLFTHNEGFSTMCGHGIIAVTTVLIEVGLAPDTAVTQGLGIDTPAGYVHARPTIRNGRVEYVSFLNVPSYLVRADERVLVDGVGEVRYDLAYGGGILRLRGRLRFWTATESGRGESADRPRAPHQERSAEGRSTDPPGRVGSGFYIWHDLRR